MYSKEATYSTYEILEMIKRSQDKKHREEIWDLVREEVKCYCLYDLWLIKHAINLRNDDHFKL